MGFRRWAELGLVVLLWGKIATVGQDTRQLEIAVLVYNHARVPAVVLSEAESEASRIFRSAGIAIQWVNCAHWVAMVDDPCHDAAGAKQFVLNVVPGGKTSSDLVFGVAFLGKEGGRYSDVFFDRMEQAQGRLGTNVPLLLGTVAAHELGHLLLGSRSHSCAGIMSPVWATENLRHIDMGDLLFNPDQATRMRSRIRDEEVRFVSFNARRRIDY